MRRFWLVTTAHLEEGVWFRDDEDFRVAMNMVAIESHRGKVRVLAFILMSNHVHFVLEGRREDVLAFINSFKQRFSFFVRKKYGIRELLRENDVDITPIPNEAEALERAIAYVLMNCVAANICVHPSQYPWGSGNVYFNVSKQSGVMIGQISVRARRKLLHSDYASLPAQWRIGGEGYIMPQDYVDTKTVEACFHTPKRMNYFLASSSKARKRIEKADENLPAFRDQSIIAALPDLCMSLFGRRSYSELSPQEQTEFLRQIRFRFSANVNQIARVCGISYEEAAKKLDAV